MSARRPWAWPLVPLYAAGVAARNGLRAAGALKTRRLRWPVISVGSISAGGAGKTPVVIALAELLCGRGWAPDVLSRGYGRDGHGTEQVQLGQEEAAKRYGDEPVLIAQRTAVPVWVGTQRFDAGCTAERAVDCSNADDSSNDRMRVHLLDDGFQHRQLARTVDIVLVTEGDLNDSLLPAGNLREPLSALRRADVVVLREEERERVLSRLNRLLPAATPVWTVTRSLSFTGAGPTLSSQPTSSAHVAFCAIARPDDFLSDLKHANVNFVDAVTFTDHHTYTMEDMDRLIAASDRSDAKGFVTTEKDAVKLSAAMREKLEARRQLMVAQLDTRFIDEDKVMHELEARLK